MLAVAAPVINSTKPLSHGHPGHEAPWDSPIFPLDEEDNVTVHEDHHPIVDRCCQHHYSNYSSANPGWEAPWDSPIFATSSSMMSYSPYEEDEDADYDDEVLTPLTLTPVTSTQQHRDEKFVQNVTVRQHDDDDHDHHHDTHEETAMHQTVPMKKTVVDPATVIGTIVNATTGVASNPENEEHDACELRDSGSRSDFLLHISGLCGCGRRTALINGGADAAVETH